MKLSLESEQRLIARAQRGDKRALETIFIMHERYMRYQASRFHIPGQDAEDNYSYAVQGLLIAIDKYQPSRKTRLLTTAYFYVRRELEHRLHKLIGTAQICTVERRNVADFTTFSQLDSHSHLDILGNVAAPKQFSMISATGITDAEWVMMKSELSELERSILDMFVGGDKHSEIVAELGISHKTVGLYINKKLPKKLSARIREIDRSRAIKT